MSDLHVYTARNQPATRYVVDLFGDDEAMVFEQPPRSLVRCWSCERRRWAERCHVQVYYDSTRFFCNDKVQCKASRRGRRRR